MTTLGNEMSKNIQSRKVISRNQFGFTLEKLEFEDLLTDYILTIRDLGTPSKKLLGIHGQAGTVVEKQARLLAKYLIQDFDIKHKGKNEIPNRN